MNMLNRTREKSEVLIARFPIMVMMIAVMIMMVFALLIQVVAAPRLQTRFAIVEATVIPTVRHFHIK